MSTGWSTGDCWIRHRSGIIKTGRTHPVGIIAGNVSGSHADVIICICRDNRRRPIIGRCYIYIIVAVNIPAPGNLVIP